MRMVSQFLPLTDDHTCQHHQTRRRPSFSYAPNAASSGDPAKAVAAVEAVLGSEIAAVLITPKLSTGGTRAWRPVKHGHS